MDRHYLTDLISRNPAQDHLIRLIGTPGYSIPNIENIIYISTKDKDQLSRFGIRLEGEPGEENTVYIDRDQDPHDAVIRVTGCSNTKIILGKGNSAKFRIAFNGSDSVFVSAGFGRMGAVTQFNLAMGPSCLAYFGLGATIVNAQFILDGTGKHILIGDDLMSSWNVVCRNFDSHGIIDLKSGSILNSAGDIHIGAHCWLGQNSSVIKGLKIGAGSIIGMGSTVTSDIPASSIAAGSPAKVVRSSVSWSRAPVPSQHEIARVQKLIFDYADSSN